MLGKLLTRVGEDRVLWGTDAIWYGSPQPQIMAFRAFEISPEFQEQLRLSRADARAEAQDLRPERGAAARAWMRTATYCGLTQDPLTAARPAAQALARDGVVTPWRARGPLTRARGADLAARRRVADDVRELPRG